MKTNKDSTNDVVEVKWYGYAALIFGILFFSGIFKDAEGPIRALDFSNIVGEFGKLGELQDGVGTLASSFRGTGGAGVKDGWLFALSLFPTVMFALGIVKVIEYLGGLAAAQKLLTPILKPLLGIPGIAGLSLIASLQSADAGASMTKNLYDNNQITDKERNVFISFQFSGAGTITNYLSSGAILFPFLGKIPIAVPLLIILVLKVFGANLMRLYITKFAKEDEINEPIL